MRYYGHSDSYRLRSDWIRHVKSTCSWRNWYPSNHGNSQSIRHFQDLQRNHWYIALEQLLYRKAWLSLPWTTRGSTIDRLDNCETVERLIPKRAFGLFSRVMHYAPFFKGISSLAVDGNEAVAVVKLAGNQPGQVVTKVLFDAVCQMDSPLDWLVYAKFMFTEGTQPIGDVFVCSSKREVVAMMAGVQSAKVDISKLRKSLMSANLDASPPQLQRSDPIPFNATSAVDVSSSGTKSTPGPPTPSEERVDTGIKEIISNYTGLHPADIPRDSVLVDLGIDSLSSIEFVAELLWNFGVELGAEELGDMTLDDLTQRLEKSTSSEAHTRVDTDTASGTILDASHMLPPSPLYENNSPIGPTAVP
ncbi:hypothetical protein K469DRAFT_745045 [Zopfia rhizophila CBS 207.26]|uniref:Carrier domain-containing protein n=1 Tax=Zopfia rhizophila CBS 207.26 TaxID=1314779 RepID=A0A6A6EML3_9PEZI|nr:hypothetical protein K469DRAFT_745045 [Zopfia rhizophila CBS 207.26]